MMKKTANKDKNKHPTKTGGVPRATGVKGILENGCTAEPDLNQATGGYAEEQSDEAWFGARRIFFFAIFFVARQRKWQMRLLPVHQKTQKALRVRRSTRLRECKTEHERHQHNEECT